MEKPVHILFVDDDKAELLILSDILNEVKSQKYEIDPAHSYEKAVEKIISGIDYDICLIDYRLGALSGIDLIKYIRLSHPYLPIILFTGQGDTNIDREAMKAGASDYLIKDTVGANLLERSIRYSIDRSQNQKQQVENEKNLREAEKFAIAGRIALVIAHEVRNPLTNIRLALQQLKEEEQIKTESSTMLFNIGERNCHRINQLITNLLDSTKFSQLNNQDVSINDLIDESLEMAQDRIGLNGIRIVRNYSPDICNVHLDKEKVKLAILNIIVNGIEAMVKDRGVLTITTSAKNGKCIIVIEDNGKGIKPEDLNSIFEPYYSGKEGGMGLGLTSTQTIIYNHGGTINVESELSMGTTFTITFNLN